MKKKIVFMLINMNVGGTEKALLNMINEIPKEDYEITLLMLEEYGGFLEYIPAHVKVEYLHGYNQIKPILNQPLQREAFTALRKGSLIRFFILMSIYIFTKIFKNNYLVFKYALKDYRKIETQYDVAVAYAGPMDFISYFVIKRIKAKKKIQWIHFDVTKIGFSKRFANKIYKEFDRIIVVSNEAKLKLFKLLPSIKNKTEVCLNIISSNTIQNQAKIGNGFKDDFDGLRLLTIGRLSKEKGQDLAIKAFLKLINDGYKVKWYCLGEGNSRKEYENLIMVNNLEDKFILLGADPNPYSYLEQCDIYVQPSRYEGYCITLIEAKQFFKPIVTTNVNGANELIVNGKTGIIVNIDENDIYYAIKNFIDNKLLSNSFSNNLAKEKYDISSEMSKILNILEG
jgi:glycosyltransferase involved in cell wall biosynthesis